MKKEYGVFIGVLLIFMVSSLSAQQPVLFSLEPGAISGSQGSTITVNITTDHFQNVTGFQFGVGWDPTVLNFTQVIYQDPLISSIGSLSFNGDPSGTFTAVWFGDFQNYNLPDNTILFTLEFVLVGPCNNNYFPFFQLLDPPLEVTTAVPGPVAVPLPANFSPPPSGTLVSVTCATCGISKLETGGEAAIFCQDSTYAADEVVIEIGYVGTDSDALVVNNGLGVISGDDPAVVPNGTIILSGLQEGEGWNISIIGGNCSLNSSGVVSSTTCLPPCGITYLASGNDVEIQCVNGSGPSDTFLLRLPYLGIDSQAIINTSGVIEIAGGDPRQLPNDTIELLVVGDIPWSYEISGNNCNLTASGNLSGLDCEEVTFSVVPSNATVDSGNTITLDVIVENFVDVTSIQFGFGWDGAVLEFVELTNLNPVLMSKGFGLGSIATPPAAGPDTLNVAWLDLSLGTTTLPDSAILFSMTFTGVGSPGSVTQFMLVPDPVLEVVRNLPNFDMLELLSAFVTNTTTITNSNSCGISALLPENYVCQSNTAGQGNDLVVVEIPYNGVDPNVMVVNNGMGVIAGDDPASVPNGTFEIIGLSEGDIWDVAVTGGQCNLIASGTIPLSLCDPVCGISAIESGNEPEILCVDSTYGTNFVIIEIGYTGADSTAMVVDNLGNATINADLTQMNGVITLTGLQEGDNWDISITGAGCNFNSTGTVGSNLCIPPCGITDIESGNEVTLSCQNSTAGTDTVIISIAYAGLDPNVTINNNGAGTIAGDNPAVDSNGVIIIENILEGETWNITLSGGGCNLTSTGTVPQMDCEPVLYVFFDTLSGEKGDTLCMEVRADNFINLLELSYNVTWDANVLDFIEVKDFNVPDMNPTNFNVINNDTLILSWLLFGANGVTLPDSSLLYRMCFEMLSCQPGTSSAVEIDPATVEVSQAGSPSTMIPLEPEAGLITSTGGDCPPVTEFTLSLDSMTNVAPGDTVCLDVTVGKFENILGLEYTVTWDNTVMQFTGVQNFGLPMLSTGNFFHPPGTGQLNFSWIANNPVTLPNGSVIYEMCFQVVGNAGDMSDLDFSNVQATEGPPATLVPNVVTNDGKLTVVDPDALQLYAECPMAPASGQVCIPVKVNNFDTVFGAQFTMRWDPAVLQYDDLANLNPNLGSMGLDPVNFNLLSPGVLNFLWIDDLNQGETLPDSATLFEVCFNVIGNSCDSSDFMFSDDPVLIEFLTQVNNVTTVIPDVAFNCTFFTSGCFGPVIEGEVTNVGCFGENTGSIDMTITGEDPLTFDWDHLPGGNDPEDVNNLTAGTYCVTVTDSNGNTAEDCFTVGEPTALSLSTQPVDESCIDECDGVITLTITGGTGPYTHNWADESGSINPKDRNNLCDGEYCVTVTDDNGCTVSTCETIDPGIGLSSDGVVEESGCGGQNNGSISLTVSGGNSTYNYNWSPSAPNSADINNLAPNTYCVTVTDMMAGCTITDCFDVEEDPGFTINALVNDVSCNGGDDGQIALTISGGSGGNNFSYNWAAPLNSDQPTVSNLSAGNYVVTVTDTITGCSHTDNFEVTQPTFLLIVVDQVTDLLCSDSQNGSVAITVSGGTPGYTYQWLDESGDLVSSEQDPGGLSEGCYEVLVMDDNGCLGIETGICLDVPAEIELNPVIDQPDNIADVGEINLNVTGGTPGYSYTWDNGLPSGPNAVNLDPGLYCITVTDIQGCTQSDCYSIACPLNAEVNNFSSPVCFGDSTGMVDITVTCGFPPYTFSWSNGSTSEDLTGLPAGTYSVTVMDDSGSIFTVGPVGLSGGSPIEITDVDVVPVGCIDDGAVDITLSGGESPYTYQWNNGAVSEDIMMLECDSFQVTITDADGCTLISPLYEVPCNIPPPDIMSFEVKAPSCFNSMDGSIDIEADTCQNSLSYQWVRLNDMDTFSTNQDVSGLLGGNYQVILENEDGQIVVQNFELLNPSPVSVSIGNVDPETCLEKGTIEISPSGGAGGYMYQWNNGGETPQLTGLDCGDYQVTITDTNGCTFVASSINVPCDTSSPFLAIADPDTLLCPGDTILLQGFSNTDTVQWFDSQGGFVGPSNVSEIEVAEAGWYTFKAWNLLNGCQSLDSTQVLDRDLPAAEAGFGGVVCEAFVRLESNLPNGLTGSWEALNGAILSNPNIPSPDVSGLEAGENIFIWSLSAKDCPNYSKDTLVVDYETTPEANDDYYALPNDSSLAEVDPLLNDNLNEVQFFLWDTLTSPSLGLLDYTVDGYFSYIPPEAFVGLDSFRYSICSELCPQNCDTATVLFAIIPSVVFDTAGIVPNVITVDGDGLNDYWDIKDIHDYPFNRLEIVNRWGDVVFERAPYQNDWRGQSQDGFELPEGVYFYNLHLDTAEGLVFRGWVLLMR